jgi:hypothetical protein
MNISYEQFFIDELEPRNDFYNSDDIEEIDDSVRS